MKKNILVTGGAGYIGSHTCKFLHQKGYNPIVLDNLVYGHRSSVKWGILVEGDVRDNIILNQIFSQYKPLAVIHFAAFAYVGESVINPGKYYENNVSGTITLLEAMRRYHCKQLVFSSTCATYGNPSFLPINEEHPQQPINPYGRSKLMIEQILADYSEAYGMAFVALRYFNAAGADLDGEIGEDHTPETHLIPLVIDAALGRQPSIKIFGTDYPTNDGTAIRDYIHVADLAEAHFKALDLLATEKKSQIFNLGTGNGTSVQEIVNAVKRLAGKEIPVEYVARRPGDPPELIASAQKAKITLGWEPKHSDVYTMIESAWKWQLSR